MNYNIQIGLLAIITFSYNIQTCELAFLLIDFMYKWMTIPFCVCYDDETRYDCLLFSLLLHLKRQGLVLVLKSFSNTYTNVLIFIIIIVVYKQGVVFLKKFYKVVCYD
jgi:hypothetical protein